MTAGLRFRTLRTMLAAVFLLLALAPAASGAEPEFADAAEEAHFRELARELRCLVCQNQSLEDSHAPLALDLKKEVLAQIRTGASDEQIVSYLVQRYGDFVRYRPPFRPGTWLLWTGPLLLFVAGAFVVRSVVRRHAGVAPPVSGTGAAVAAASPREGTPSPRSGRRRHA